MTGDGSFTAGYNSRTPGVTASSADAPPEETPKIDAPRFADANKALDAYRVAKKADEVSALNRANVQSMVDGKPPFSTAALKAAGRPWATNINFQEAAALVEAGTTSYNNLIDTVVTLARAEMLPGTFEPVEEIAVAEAIGEELSDLLREDAEFAFNWETIGRQVTTHGLAIAYFPEDEGVEWCAGGLDDFLIPRQTRSTESAVDVLFALKKTPLSDIVKILDDEETAKELGWNTTLARKSVVRSIKGTIVESWASDWAEVSQRLKNNDFGETFGSAQTIPVVHMWVKERGGEISHYMFLADGSGEKDFLFSKRNRFIESTDAFVIFTAGIGTNGTYHSVRGLAYRLYDVIGESNKLRCNMLDGVKMAMTLGIQPKDSESIEDMTLIQNGTTTFIPPDCTIQQMQLGNPAQVALPIINDLSQLLGATTGSFRPRGAATEGVEKTRFEVNAQIESQSALTTSAVNVFYRSFERFLNAYFRRVKRLDPMELAITGDHPAVLDFYRRLEARGVSADAVQAVKKIVPVRAIGLGSPSQRLAAVTGVSQLLGSMDEVGRQTWTRMVASGYLGRDQVNALFPKSPSPRLTQDDKNAELEHAALREREVAVQPQELHATHAQVHFGILQQDFQEIAQEIEQGEPDDKIEDVQYLQRALVHVAAHVDQLRADVSRKEQVAQFDDFLGQISAAWKRLADQVQAAMDEKQVSPEGQAAAPDLQAKMQEHQLKLQMMQESHAQKMQQKEQDFQQRQRLRLIQTDQRLAQSIQNHNLKVYGPAAVRR